MNKRRGRGLAVAVLLTVATTTAIVALSPARAGAHEGETVYIDEVDGYYVEVSDSIVPDTGLFYTVFLRSLDRGLPVDDASVEVTARSDDTVFGPATTARLGNAYSALIPDNGVAEWTVDVRIDHPTLGITRFSHPLAGVAGHEDGPWWTSTPVLVVAWTLPVVGLFMFHRAGQRRRTQNSPA